jgi:hypothetical protein
MAVGVIASVLLRDRLENPRLRVLSLGAGVQSSTLALMAARGEVGPMPDCAIFADTQSEPAKVYAHLDWLEKQLPFPVHRVTAGSLRDEILGAMSGKNRMDARPPFFTKSGGMLHRQCTQDFKIIPIVRKVRELIGLKPRQRGPKSPVVEQWIGISRDESVRMKSSRLSFIQHRWPLLEMEMTRAGCIKWLTERQLPIPPKSACTFCPFTDQDRWADMKVNDVVSFADAVHIDEVIRPGMPGPKRPKGDAWFVHRSRQPLAIADLSSKQSKDGSFFGDDDFGNECEGMCGV